jgi:DNA topoisomerase-1
VLKGIVIVESPAKAKTLETYLGRDYKVIASYGHIRDLVSKSGSVDTNDHYKMLWEANVRGKKQIKEIADNIKNSSNLFLATDPDREGEAISWHILEVLNEKKLLKNKNIKRVVFHEITKSAVQKAFESPKDLDNNLVDAYLARRVLDYLVGFSLSPVLWRKMPGARSAGRVQSVALRLIVERELEIQKFNQKNIGQFMEFL